MSKVKLMQGDNILSLKKLPDNSVDSIVSDPPYGLSFMNKKWDYDVPSVQFWKEVLRVLKPGGHVLSFGGTRTYHRMVVNIEDAGFEIRDQIMWLYGSGFPKSLNISKQIDKTYICEYRKIAKTAVKSLRLLQVKLNEDTDDSVPENVVILQEENQENKMVIGVVEDLSQTDMSIYATMENIEANTTLLLKNILEEDLNQEKKFITLTELKTIIDLKIWNLLQKQNTRGNTPIHESVMNMGTSLKPANEPICVARKPLSEKSVAENVLRWGTGGINIDGCRVGSDGGTKRDGQSDKVSNTNPDLSPTKSLNRTGHGVVELNEGRFPANIILECLCDEVIKGEKGEVIETKARNERFDPTQNNSKNIYISQNSFTTKDYNDKGDIHTNPNCPCRLLDEQSGESKSIKSKRSGAIDSSSKTYNWNNGDSKEIEKYECGFSDKGGASRYFYQAKVSKAERNMGLDGFEDKTSQLNSGGIGRKTSVEKRLDSNGENAPTTKNSHPTLKPINLMSYLVRLVTPPNGIVLDPFMGSGSTGIAAQLEGFRFCGMEMDEEYFKIAEARIENYEKYRKFIK